MGVLQGCLLLFAGLACSEAYHSFQQDSPTEQPVEPNGKIWALLVAASSGWENYRHQADVCHAYQILHRNGIPDENIIVMMMDDIAFNKVNPTPGKIFNYPGGPNVYEGVPKDYIGKDITPENLLNVLTGNKTAMSDIGSGKVIESGPNDLVFVNLVVHGGPGVLFFPNEDLYADDFLKAIDSMYRNEMYSKLIIYVEASHAGSMFDNLLSHTTNVFALVATDPHESSFACYFDDKRGTYLGDVFSVMWMNDTENENLFSRSLNQQFQKIRTHASINHQHVEEYGHLEIGATKLEDVFGFKTRLMKPTYRLNSTFGTLVVKPQHLMDAESNREVPLTVLYKNLEKKTYIEDQDAVFEIESEIHEMKKKRKLVDNLFDEVLARVAGNIYQRKKELKISKYGLNLDKFPCYKKLCSTFSNSCFSFISNPYTRAHMQKFVNLCSTNWLKEDEVVQHIKSVCRDRLGPMKLVNIE